MVGLKPCCSLSGHGNMPDTDTLVRRLWNNLWKAQANNQKTAAVIDAYRALFGNERSGGAFAAACRDCGHETVMRAVFEAARQDANVPEQYVIKTARARYEFAETEKAHARRERERSERQVDEARERAAAIDGLAPVSDKRLAELRALSDRLLGPS